MSVGFGVLFEDRYDLGSPPYIRDVCFFEHALDELQNAFASDYVRFIWYRWCPCCLVFWGRQFHPLRRDTVKARCFAVA